MLTDLRGRARAGVSGRAARAAIRAEKRLEDSRIDVVPLADGIVELRGTVDTVDEARRAVELAQRPPAVRTVLNRLRVENEEERLARTRRRFAAGAADLHETHWYGMRSGMGRRRRGNDRRRVMDDEVETSGPDDEA